MTPWMCLTLFYDFWGMILFINDLGYFIVVGTKWLKMGWIITSICVYMFAWYFIPADETLFKKYLFSLLGFLVCLFVFVTEKQFFQSIGKVLHHAIRHDSQEWFKKIFLLLFKYSFLPFPPTPPYQPSPPHLLPLFLPPLIIDHMSFIIVPVNPSPFSPLSPPFSPLVTVSLFSISVPLVILCLLVRFVD